MSSRPYRAGESIEDYCRACKTDRMHTIIAVDYGGHPIRVMCGFCRSEHNYRGGPRIDVSPSSPVRAPQDRPEERRAAASPPPAARRPEPTPGPERADFARLGDTWNATRDSFPVVSHRERSAPPVMLSNTDVDLELLLRRIIREEAGISAVAPAEKWRGGSLVLRPGRPGVQEKSWPIETFFHKVVMLRNRLRTLEQQLNASDLPEDVKVKLQGYVSGCYGSLTSFNILFADEDDQFKGSASVD